MTEFQLLCHPDKMLFAYQVSPQFGKLSFPKMGEAMEQLLGGNESQNRISQKLELLVVTHAAAFECLQRFQFPGLGSMGQCLLEQCRPREAVPQNCFQYRDVPGLHDLRGCATKVRSRTRFEPCRRRF